MTKRIAIQIFFYNRLKNSDYSNYTFIKWLKINSIEIASLIKTVSFIARWITEENSYEKKANNNKFLAFSNLFHDLDKAKPTLRSK